MSLNEITQMGVISSVANFLFDPWWCKTWLWQIYKILGESILRPSCPSEAVYFTNKETDTQRDFSQEMTLGNKKGIEFYMLMTYPSKYLVIFA